MRHSAVQASSHFIAAALLLAAIMLHLIPALFAGMLVYTVIDKLSPRLARLTSGRASHLAASILVAAFAVGIVSLGATLLIAQFKSDSAGGLAQLWAKLAEVVDSANTLLPAWITASLPASAEDLRIATAGLLREHSAEIQGIGKEFALALVHVVIGGILGAMIAVSRNHPASEKALAINLRQRAANFFTAFERVFIGQGKIALINTTLTAVFLAIALPLAGIHLPFIKTMLAVTLLVGILPVVGNLISNTMIVVVAASVSFNAALAALAFLVLLHKSEYLLSARILGQQIQSRAWEMLLAMLLIEAAFGLPGIASAPVYYAYLKNELIAADLV